MNITYLYYTNVNILRILINNMLVTCNFRFYNIRTEHNMRYTLINYTYDSMGFPVKYLLFPIIAKITKYNN